jgi:hypothetical protein
MVYRAGRIGDTMSSSRTTDCGDGLRECAAKRDLDGLRCLDDINGVVRQAWRDQLLVNLASEGCVGCGGSQTKGGGVMKKK